MITIIVLSAIGGIYVSWLITILAVGYEINVFNWRFVLCALFWPITIAISSQFENVDKKISQWIDP